MWLPLLGSAVASDIVAHELTQDLSCRLVLRPADFEELLAQFALNPYAEANILHGEGVYPLDTHLCSLKS